MILKFAPQKQRNHKYISRSIDQWLDIHFGDTSFNGRVVIGHRKPHAKGIYTMSVRPLTELRPYVKMIHVSSRLDYYITANTVTGTNRRAEDLFGLQNMVIDIDYHDEERPQRANMLVEAFIWRFKRDLVEAGVIPSPNSIVRTGRGVQLWWAIVPCYGGKGYDKSRFYHDKIKTSLMDHIEVLIGEYPDELEGLGVDRGASSNLVGFFRMPGTYNTTAKCYSSVEILHTDRYDQRDLAKMESLVRPKQRGVSWKVRQRVPMQESDRFVLVNCQSTGGRRLLQLVDLRNLRNNDVGSEMRDCFNFSVYNTLRMTLDHEGAMMRLRAFNRGFKKPMTDRELDNCVSSAKEIEGYKYSNEKLIELLEITPDEQNAIGLFPVTEKRRTTQNASRDAIRTALKEDRDMKILELIEKGISQAETARMLGIGKNTVGRVLKRLRNAIGETEITEQTDRHQNGAIYVLNDSPADKMERFMEDAVSEEEGLFVMLEYRENTS